VKIFVTGIGVVSAIGLNAGENLHSLQSGVTGISKSPVFNLMLGLLTPPVGLCLYITGRIADVSLEEVSKAAFPFLLVGIGVLILITVFPALTVWLPRAWLG